MIINKRGIVKGYPERNAEARVKMNGVKKFFFIGSFNKPFRS